MFRYSLLVLSRVDLVVLIGCWCRVWDDATALDLPTLRRCVHRTPHRPHPSGVLRRVFGAAP
jgi:hypothetical protein